jgi:hypothetical protein
VTLKVKQDSAPEGGDRWKWSVWLDGAAKDLDAVDHVVYTLHPTFPDPVQRVKSRRTGFKIEGSGWGEFEVYLDIALKDGTVRRRKHWLKLADTEGKEQRPAAQERPRAYISNGPADGLLARKLSEILREKGFRVETSENHPAGLPWEKAIDQMLESADIAVFFLSGQPSLWTHTEIERALVHGVPHIVPVLVGSAAEVPRLLQDRQAFHVDSPAQVEALAKSLLQVLDATP